MRSISKRVEWISINVFSEMKASRIEFWQDIKSGVRSKYEGEKDIKIINKSSEARDRKSNLLQRTDWLIHDSR